MQMQTSMRGSSEVHSANFYKRDNPVPVPPARRPMDPLFKPGLDVIAQSSIKSLLAQITATRGPPSPASAPPHASVYVFDVGLPPALLHEIADRFNASHSAFLVCYHGESLMVNCHDFDVSRIVLVSGITIQKIEKEWSQPGD